LCAIELLERRRLLATVTAVITADRLLKIEATSGDAEMELHSTRAVTTVTTNGVPAVQTFDNRDFDGISITANSGDDRIVLAESVLAPATIFGGWGDDLVVGGAGDDDITSAGTLIGGAGNDRITGESYTLVHGGDGDDTIVVKGYDLAAFGDAGNDLFKILYDKATLDGGAGDADEMDFSEIYQAAITGGGGHITDTRGLPREYDYARIERLIGSARPDSLTLTDSDSLVFIDCLNGDDTVVGAARGETLIGGGGDDLLIANGGDDLLVGDSGDDLLDSGAGRDTLVGGTESGDVLVSQKHDNVDRSFARIIDRILHVVGTSGDDRIQLVRKPGNGNAALRVMVNGARRAQIGLGEFDSIRIGGGDGGDSISVDTSIITSAVLNGDDGDDRLTPGGGVATLDGGAGADAIDLSARTDSITRDGWLAQQIITGAGDEYWYLHIESLLSGSGEDNIYVGYYAGWDPDAESVFFVDGGPGDDNLGIFMVMSKAGVEPVVHGGDGDDYISVTDPGNTAAYRAVHYFGDAGNDTLYVQRYFSYHNFHGGPGIDKLNYGPFSTAGTFVITLDDKPGDGPRGYDNVYSDIEEVWGSPWGNTMIGSDKDETLHGAGRNDLLIGNGGNDVLIGGGTLKGGEGDDSLFGNWTDDVLDGGPGDDTLLGNSGNDTLIGGPGDDVLDGGDGKNVIIDESRRDISTGRLLDELNRRSGDLLREIP
jgi:Ca2+-binding RTX toxin-like protein